MTCRLLGIQVVTSEALPHGTVYLVDGLTPKLIVWPGVDVAEVYARVPEPAPSSARPQRRGILLRD